jgi:MerR family redox-sensitive transcriptional activator SoxR
MGALGVLTISEVARQAGVRSSTLRYYEMIGLLPEPQRISGKRRYEETVLQRLAIIQTAQQAGFTLTEIRVLLDEILRSSSPTPQWRELVQRKLREVNSRLRQVESMRSLLEDVMQCNDPELADCIYVTGQKHRLLDENLAE